MATSITQSEIKDLTFEKKTYDVLKANYEDLLSLA